jgi:hypothetical protein
LITAKNIKEEEISTHANQIIFRKNTKKDDCCVYLFEECGGHEGGRSNTIIQKMNPKRYLSCFFVQFSDFEVLDVE